MRFVCENCYHSIWNVLYVSSLDLWFIFQGAVALAGINREMSLIGCIFLSVEEYPALPFSHLCGIQHHLGGRYC